MNIEEFIASLNELGIVVNDEQLNQFEQYYKLLIMWNEKINLTAITEAKEVYLKHFYDSITLATAYDFAEQELSICDVGAGAGFPSLPLKIVFPNLKITIVDSLNKRINFLQTVVDELGLKNVQLHHSRAEDFGQNKDFRGQYDVVTARAVARLNVLAELCLPLVRKGGVFIALKAAKTEQELIEAKKAISVLGGKLFKSVDLELPITCDNRHLVVIKKVKETPNKYPRKAGIPNKKPLC